jgi:hypothetical protein
LTTTSESLAAYACLIRGTGKTIVLYGRNAEKVRAEVADLFDASGNGHHSAMPPWSLGWAPRLAAGV